MTGEKPKLLVTTSTFPKNFDSAEPDFVLQLSKRLNKCFAVTVLAPDCPETELLEDFDGLRVVRFRYFFKRYQTLSGESGIPARLRQQPWRLLLIPLFVIAQVIAIKRLLNRGDFDLLHAHWMLPQGACALLANRLADQPVPIVTTVHGADLYALQWPGLSAVKAWVLRHSRAVAAVSHAMKADLGALLTPGSDSIEVLPMGVDLRCRFAPAGKDPREPRQILFVGRLVPKKGVHHLIAAMKPVVERMSKVRLLVVGSGPEETRLRELRSRYGLCEEIEFFGAATSATIARLMQASGIVVVPSVTAPDGDREGLGLVTIEAMGCACAVVAHDFAAVHDVIVHEKTGLLVPQGDEPALSKALLRLLADPELQLELGANARQSVLKRYDWDPAADRYVQLFLKLMDNPKPAQIPQAPRGQ